MACNTLARFKYNLLILLLMVLMAETKLPDLEDVNDAGLFDLSRWSRVTSTSTCGLDGPETFCLLTDPGLNNGHVCHTCDSSSSELSHPVSNILDGTNSFWKSANAKRRVTIDIDFGREFYVSYVTVTMGPSPRPADWVIERSDDFGVTYQPWQYFVENPISCQRRFGIPANLSPGTPDQVLCQSDTFKILKYEEVFLMLVKGRPGDMNFAANRKLQDWSRATNVRIRFLRLQTLGGEKIHNDVSIRRRHFYSIQSVVVGGRCICHGHEDTCIFDRFLNEIRCVCTGNTCGPSCSECCPAYHQRPWTETDDCQPCNCHGHSDRCIYNATVARMRLSKDVNGDYIGDGGVCVDCLHNTEGVNCERCKRGFYRINGIETNDTRSCQACDCDSLGSSDGYSCHTVSGQCSCHDFIGGRQCDGCIGGYWDFPNCKPCNCSRNGSVSQTCHPKTGKCRCHLHVSGLKCDTCLNPIVQILTVDGCLACDACGVNIFNETVRSLSSDIETVSHWTDVVRQDLATNPNLVDRMLNFFESQLLIARNLTNAMPIPDLKSLHDAGIISRLNVAVFGLASQYSDVKLNWVSERHICDIFVGGLKTDSQFGQCNTSFINALMFSCILAVCSVKSKLTEKKMYENVESIRVIGGFDGLTENLCGKECWTYVNEAVRVITGSIDDSLLAVKVKSHVELKDAKELRSFVQRFFWNFKRVHIALSKFIELLNSVSKKCRMTHDANVYNRPLLKRVKMNIKKLQRHIKLVPSFTDVPLARVSKDLRQCFTDLAILENRLDETNYETIADWSEASMHLLEVTWQKHVLPHVDVLQLKETEISRLSHPLQAQYNVRKSLVENLAVIVGLMSDAHKTINDLINEQRKISASEIDGSGNGSPNNDNEDDENLFIDSNDDFEIFSKDGIGDDLPVRTRFEEQLQIGLNLKRRNLYMSNRVKATSMMLANMSDSLDAFEGTMNQNQHDLHSILEDELYSPLKDIKNDLELFTSNDLMTVSQTVQRVDESLQSAGNVYHDLEVAASVNRKHFAEARHRVFNVTSDVANVRRLTMMSIKPWRGNSHMETIVANLKNAINEWHKYASRYQMAIALDKTSLQLPMKDLLFPYSVVTRVEMAFKSSLENSFLLLIGSDFAVAGCRVLVYLNESVLTLSLRREVHTVNISHPLPVRLDTWYQFKVHWILDSVNLTLTEVKRKGTGLIIAGKFLSSGGFYMQNFDPALVFVGGLPRDIELQSSVVNLQDFRGCVDSLRINGRPVGLMSRSVKSCSSSAISPKDKLDTLSFDGRDAMCIDLPNVNIGLNLSFRLRTIERNCIVVFIQFQSEVRLAVALKNGEIIVQLSRSGNKLDGNKLTVTSGLLTSNDGQTHSVEVIVKGNALYLTVDRLYRSSQIVLQFGSLQPTKLYLGGAPNDVWYKNSSSICPAANFHGCLMDFRMSNYTPTATYGLTTALTTCPEMYAFECMCSLKRGIRLKKLGFPIRNLTIAFTVRLPLSLKMKTSNRTLLHYSATSNTGFEVIVRSQELNSLSATVKFWSREGSRQQESWQTLNDERWHLIAMETSENSTLVVVDGRIYEASGLGFIQGRIYEAQHRLLLGLDDSSSFSSIQFDERDTFCYKDLIINNGPFDSSYHIDLSSDVTTCPIEL